MKDTLRKVQVVIVGAGPAGCLFAATLAGAGREVVVYEAGPPWRLDDLVSSQIWARRLKWGGAPVQRAGTHPFGHNYATGWGLGGAALHHYAGWPRLRPEDFELQSRYGRGIDWPFGYEELRPWYARIEREVGVAGDVASEPWRPDPEPYPMAPVQTFRQARVIARGFEAQGLRVGPTPVAINSAPYAGRPACIYDGWCDAGCPTGALANPLVTYQPRAIAAGARFASGHQITRIALDARGRATGVELRDAAGNARLQPAEVIVLAAAAVQNPRILLNSTHALHPGGLGNGSGLLGRRFFSHTVLNVYGLFDEDLENHMGLTVPSVSCADGTYDKQRDGGPFGSYGFGIAPALKPNDLLGIAISRADLFGAGLHAFMKRAARGLGSIVSLCETLPEHDNRIELASQTDRHGMPLARIVNGFSDESIALWNRAREHGTALMRAAGADEVWHGPLLGAHLLGGTLMGRDPAASVTNAWGQLYEAPNVVVAGSGLFPSCGAMSPTFTIHALALRTAERMLSHAAEFTA
ncbi:MAG: GMC family oxidoreductase [Gammaproteobacteria bacterium]|nr:GMC family oxidoreductase [Gammaproteobacteria bacterium]